MNEMYRQHAAKTIRTLREHARWEYNYRLLMGQYDEADLAHARWDHYGAMLVRLLGAF